MNSATMSPEVQKFAAAVRTHLDDLPADDVDDLTDGLEADLAESLAEAASASEVDAEPDARLLGDPVAYAAELRAAAGFAPRIRSARRFSAGGVGSWFEAARDTFAARVTSTKTGRVVWSFFGALRPLWWVARGWAIFHVFVALALGPGRTEIWPNNPILGLVQIAVIVLSVQWGRGLLLASTWLRRTKMVTSIVAIIAMPFLLAALRPAYDVQYVETAAEPVAGLSQNGQPVGNIFAYDASGELLTGVQLFDQNGAPLAIATEGDAEIGYFQYFTADGLSRYLLPSDLVPGRDGWNVYPLREIAEEDIDFSTYPVSVDGAKAPVPVAPFAQVQPLAESASEEMTPVAPSPSPSPSSSSSGSPSVGPEPSPSPSATTEPSPSPSP